MTRSHSALLLDLDGTLLDTAPDMGGALNRLRAENGLDPLPAAAMRPVVSHGCGPAGHARVSRRRPATSSNACACASSSIYSREPRRCSTRLFPGVEAVLDELERLRPALGRRHQQAGLAHRPAARGAGPRPPGRAAS